METKMTPSHPGEILKGLYLDPLDITISDASIKLGVSRKTLSYLINKRSGISVEMAIRLSKAFKTTPELWLNIQQNYDLWHALRTMKSLKIPVLV